MLKLYKGQGKETKMSDILYLECSAGISGDMAVAALLDLGASRKALSEALDSISAQGFSTEIGRVKKAGIDCCDFRVILDEEHENHDHDMEYLHGGVHSHIHGSEEEHVHSHDGGHRHVHGDEDHGHAHDHHNGHGHVHHHEHRGMSEIREILSACRMTEHAREIAEKIFAILAEAEAKAHNLPVDEVHFHEVGAIDSIVDIVAAAVCIDSLGITEVIVPKLCEGTGTVRCQHGILPVPVPAVANILSAYHLRIELMDVQGEFVTPTGAAIAAAVRTSDRLPAAWTIKKIGIGAGKRMYERPSILRAMLIEDETTDKAGCAGAAEENDTVCKLETNIDDSSGETLGYVMTRLLEAGARDVHYMPVYMKKNRPGWQLNVICTEAERQKLEQIIFSETTTIGIRRTEMKRTILPREQMILETEYGEAAVKVCTTADGKRYYPEYDSIVRICREHGLPFAQVYQMLGERAVEKGNQ